MREYLRSINLAIFSGRRYDFKFWFGEQLISKKNIKVFRIYKIVKTGLHYFVLSSIPEEEQIINVIAVKENKNSNNRCWRGGLNHGVHVIAEGPHG